MEEKREEDWGRIPSVDAIDACERPIVDRLIVDGLTNALHSYVAGRAFLFRSERRALSVVVDTG
jgi:hypothetical protein